MPFKKVLQFLLLHCDRGETGAFYIATDQGHWGEFLLNKGVIVGVRYRALRGVKALQLLRRSAQQAKYSFNSSGFKPDLIERDGERLPDTDKIFQFLGASSEAVQSGQRARAVRADAAAVKHSTGKAGGAEKPSRPSRPSIAPPATHSRASRLAKDAPLAAYTVLVVEDSVISRRVILNTLSPKGYRILEASDGFQAVDILSRERPDLMLLDLIMPGMDGYKVLTHMKKDRELSKIPVIILSSRDSLFDKLKGKMSGSDEYLTKPFSSLELENKVSQYLK